MTQARDMYKGAGEDRLAERANFDSNIFGYSYKNVLDEGPSKSNWGRFGPTGIGRDKDGKERYFPDPAWIDEAMLRHALERTKETKNSIVLAIYYDLLFEHSRVAGKHKFAISAIENYISASEIQFENNWGFEMIDSLLRSLELAVKIKDKNVTATVIDEIYRYINKINEAGNPRYSLELLEGLLKFSKHLPKRLLKRVISEARIGVDYFGGLKGDNRHIQRSFLGVVQEAYKKLSEKDKVDTIEVEKASSFLKEAEEKSGSGLVEAHFLEEALNIIRKVKDPKKEESKIRRKIEEAYLKAESEMKPISVKFQITEKQRQDFLNGILVDSNEESLVRIGASPRLIPSLKHAENLTKNLMKKYPLQHLFGRNIIQDGRKITFSSGGFGLTEDDIAETLGRDHLTVNSIFMGFVFDELKRRGVGGTQIAEFLKDKDLYKNYDNFDAVTDGLKNFDEKDYFSSLNVLVLQTENVMRESLRTLGYPTLRVDRDGSQKAIMIAEILEAPPLKDILGLDRYWYFRLIMYDKRGRALRDSIGHGLLKKSRQNQLDSYLIIHLLLILSAIGIKDKVSKS